MEGVADSVGVQRVQPAQRRAHLSIADVAAAGRRRVRHKHQLDASVGHVAVAGMKLQLYNKTKKGSTEGWKRLHFDNETAPRSNVQVAPSVFGSENC